MPEKAGVPSGGKRRVSLQQWEGEQGNFIEVKRPRLATYKERRPELREGGKDDFSLAGGEEDLRLQL